MSDLVCIRIAVLVVIMVSSLLSLYALNCSVSLKYLLEISLFLFYCFSLLILFQFGHLFKANNQFSFSLTSLYLHDRHNVNYIVYII